MAQSVKNPPAMQETWVRSPGQEDPLEEGVATHSSILAWGTRIPHAAGPGQKFKKKENLRGIEACRK